VGEVPVPADAEEWEALKARWLEKARATAFAGWPEDKEIGEVELKPGIVFGSATTYSQYKLNSQPGVTSSLSTVDSGGKEELVRLSAFVISGPSAPPQDQIENHPSRTSHARITLRGWTSTTRPEAVDKQDSGSWPPKLDPSLRRRFALIGQTLDGQRVWDFRRGIQAIKRIDRLKDAQIELVADETTAHLALWAAVFEPEVESLTIVGDLPADFPERPAFLGLDRVLTNAQALALLYPRPVILPAGTDPARWAWAFELGKKLDPSRPWPTIAEPKGDR
jgi:hypothetical protein